MSIRSAALGVFLLLVAAPTSAQYVTGRVIEQHTNQPIAVATVELRMPDGRRIARGVTDSTGRFVMQAARIGEYTLVAERIGYQTVTSSFAVGVSEEAEIVIRMDATALALDPLTVEARTPRNIGLLAGYYERVERMQRVGLGNVITRDRIDERGAGSVADLFFEVPRVKVRGGVVTFPRGASPAGCTPKVYVDGVLSNRGENANVNVIHPLDLEGVEVYQGLAQMPGEFYDTSGCGVIALWTRRGLDSGRPFSWKRLFAAAALVGTLVLIGR